MMQSLSLDTIFFSGRRPNPTPEWHPPTDLSGHHASPWLRHCHKKGLHLWAKPTHLRGGHGWDALRRIRLTGLLQHIYLRSAWWEYEVPYEEQYVGSSEIADIWFAEDCEKNIDLSYFQCNWFLEYNELLI